MKGLRKEVLKHLMDKIGKSEFSLEEPETEVLQEGKPQIEVAVVEEELSPEDKAKRIKELEAELAILKGE